MGRCGRVGVKLPTKRRWVFCLFLAVITYAFYLAGGWIVRQRALVHPWRGLQGCGNEESEAYLRGLCHDYLNGVVAGSLCEPLCVRKEVEFVKCLGHGVKLHVLLAQWAANTVVLKTAKPLGSERAMSHLERPDKFTRKITKQEFIHEANMSVFLNLAGGRYVSSTLAAVERVFSECDVLGDGQLSYSEAVVCWQLLETDEFIILSVLRGLSAMPDIYGACGIMYAMQYATSQPFLDRRAVAIDQRTWQFRARLAIALIEMVHSIETTPYGTLYLCDVQESNFGIVRRPGTAKLVAKTIDVDISWFEENMKSSVVYEKNKKCQSDIDCDFVSCRVVCNKSTGTCSGKLWSNNLQVICRRLFVQRMIGFSGLLTDPPQNIRRELTSALKQCGSSSLPQPHINITIMNTLLSLLRKSLAIDHISPS